MPVKKAAYKHLRQTKKRTEKNLKEKDNIKYLLKQIAKAAEAKDKAKAEELAKKAIKAIDKAIQHKVIKKNTGARQKSKMMAKINKFKTSENKEIKKEGK